MLVKHSYKLKEILESNKMANAVLLRYDINRKNDHPLSTICGEKEIDTSFLIDVINHLDDQSHTELESFYAYEIPTLIDYLERSHKFYRNTILPKIGLNLDILLSGSNSNAHLLVCANMFKKFNDSLINHLYFEEKNLFTYYKYIYNAYCHNWNRYLVMNYIDLYSIDDFVNSHPKIERNLDYIIDILSNYTPQSSHKLTYNIIMRLLKNLKRDLELHALIEDEVLIEKVLKIRSEIMLF